MKETMKEKHVAYAIGDFVLTDEEVEILENLGWRVLTVDCQNKIPYVEIETWSPAGENLVETIWIEPGQSFAKAAREWANSFDPDEHVELWVDSRGKRGVPDTIKALVDDAHAIQTMFNDLADELEEFEKMEEDDAGALKEYRIPLVWQMFGHVWVTAHSKREAMDLALNSPDYPLPEGFYVDDSLEVDEDCEIEVNVLEEEE